MIFCDYRHDCTIFITYSLLLANQRGKKKQKYLYIIKANSPFSAGQCHQVIGITNFWDFSLLQLLSWKGLSCCIFVIFFLLLNSLFFSSLLNYTWILMTLACIIWSFSFDSIMNRHLKLKPERSFHISEVIWCNIIHYNHQYAYTLMDVPHDFVFLFFAMA